MAKPQHIQRNVGYAPTQQPSTTLQKALRELERVLTQANDDRLYGEITCIVTLHEGIIHQDMKITVSQTTRLHA